MIKQIRMKKKKEDIMSLSKLVIAIVDVKIHVPYRQYNQEFNHI